MTLWRTTLLRPDTPPEPNGTGEKEEITAWLTEGAVERAPWPEWTTQEAESANFQRFLLGQRHHL